MRVLVPSLVLALLVAAPLACRTPAVTPCAVAADCEAPEVCVEGACVVPVCRSEDCPAEAPCSIVRCAADAGPLEEDAGPPADAGVDAGAPDAGGTATDAGADAGPPVDGGPQDGGLSLGPTVVLVEEAASVVAGAVEDDGAVLLLPERRGAALQAALPCDVHVPASWGPDLVPPAICEVPSGLVVDSWLLHYDPVGAATERTVAASLVFPRPVVAVVARSGRLDGSDPALGLPATAYPDAGADADRGTEVALDQLSLGGDRRSLSLVLATRASTDQLRVLTLPEGAALPFLASTTVLVEAALPADLSPNVVEDDQRLRLYREASGVALASDLAVEATGPGVYTSTTTFTRGSIPAGTAVSSVLLHFDPVGTTTQRLVSATLTFEAPILGLILEGASLAASDAALGVAGTTYGPGDFNRGFDPSPPGDRVRFAEDGRSLFVELDAQGGADEIRVVLGEGP